MDIIQTKGLVKGNDQGGAAFETLLEVEICIRAGAVVSVMEPGG